MIEFGKTLKTARETKGLTIADIANRTHMMSSMVADLENENFSRLPAPIYGRGFIKLYCSAVDIDPAPLIAEFTEIYNGNREPAIRERTVSSPPVPESIPTPSPEPVVAAEPPPREQYDLFSTPVSPTATKAEDETPPAPREFKRYASPLRERVDTLPSFAPAIGRWCIVVLALILVLVGAAFGIRALYRATSGVHEETTAKTTIKTSEKRPNTLPRTSVKTNREPIDIPPLYID